MHLTTPLRTLIKHRSFISRVEHLIVHLIFLRNTALSAINRVFWKQQFFTKIGKLIIQTYSIREMRIILNILIFIISIYYLLSIFLVM